MVVSVSGQRASRDRLGVVCGRVDYSGIKLGRIYVGLFADLRDVCAVATVSIGEPGEFRIESVCPGAYYVLAGLDADPWVKPQPDSIVAYGSWCGERPLVVRSGEVVTGIAIELRDEDEDAAEDGDDADPA